MTSISSGENGQPMLVFGDGMPLGHEVVAAADPAMQRATLTALRKSLKSLALSQDEEDLFRKTLIDNAYETDIVYTDHLARWQPDRRNIIAYLARCTNAELISFSEHNLAQQLVRQGDLDLGRPIIDNEVRLGVERLQASGLVDARIANMYHRTISATDTLVAADPFDAAGLLANGFCTEDGMISLNRPYVYSDALGMWESRAAVDTSSHEYTHAIGIHHGTGFAFNDVELILLEELVAAHWAAVAAKPPQDPNIIIPQETSGYYAYFAERTFTGSLLQYAPTEVGVEHLRDAYFNSGRRQAVAVQGLLRALDAVVEEVLPGMTNWNTIDRLWTATPPVRKPKLLAALQNTLDKNIGRNTVEESDSPMNTPVYQP